MIFDQTMDISGQETARILQTYKFPEVVKYASHDMICGNGSLDRSDFADPVEKRFPINNPAAVLVSAAFLFEKSGELDPSKYKEIENRILEAARTFNILNEIDNLRNQIANNDPRHNLPEEWFGIVDDNGNRYYPLRNADEIKTAAEYFIKHRSSFPWKLRNMFASRILKAAERCNISVSQFRNELVKSASQGICTKEGIRKEIQKRIQWAYQSNRTINLVESLRELDSLLDKSAEDLQELAKEIISFFDQLDQKFNWTEKYAGTLPEDEVYTITETELEQISKDLVENEPVGVVYSLGDILSSIPRKNIEKAIGKKAFDESLNDLNQLDAQKLSRALQDEKRANAFHTLICAYGIPIVGKIKKKVSVKESMSYDK